MPRLLTLLLVTISFLCSTLQALAQEYPYHPANKDEIVGFWRLIPVAEYRKPHQITPDPWPSMCQWFAYYDDGSLKTIEKLREPCGNLSNASLSEAMKNTPAIISWKHSAAAKLTQQPSLISVTRSDVKNYLELWDVLYVTEAFPKEKPEFLPGDLILNLVDMKTGKALYIRHLRRLNTE
ncbi:hypothetical protein [Methylovorus mays]|uniref:hypothetical protein n=1 Tax=Methylovorus mays TaxID=184077 RepID=UPI001E35A1A5|nr:hypothetical protein [Methylovorus mays]MCB5206548.1 hypothetical protein [Methylovorus mays]